MTRSAVFTLLCDHLRAGLLKGAPPPAGDTPWELLIEASSHHFVTPTLAGCLEAEAKAPAHIRDYLDAALALNGERNQHLLAGLARIVSALNVIDIRPMLLKGAAHLADHLYPSPALRVLGDLDVLIPEHRTADALAALKRARFDFELGAIIDPRFHHLPMLYEGGTGIGVELHVQGLVPPHDAIIPASRFWEQAREMSFRQGHICLPDATCRAGHNVVHNQLQDKDYSWHRVELRQLLDVVLLREQHESAIDWTEIEQRLCDAGHRQILATYLEYARVLFGQAAPNLSQTPRPHAIAELYRAIEQPQWRRWASVGRLPLAYLAARRRNPSGFLKLFNPASWPKRIRLFMATLKTNW